MERGVSRTESATFKNRALDNISSDYYSLINSLLCLFDCFFCDISTGRLGVATIDGMTIVVSQSTSPPQEKLLPLRRILRISGTVPTYFLSNQYFVDTSPRDCPREPCNVVGDVIIQI